MKFNQNVTIKLMSSFNGITFSIYLLICFLSPIQPASAAGSKDLEVTISTDSSLESSGTIVFTVKNVSQYSAEILTWNTPLEGIFTSKSFRIHRDGKKVPYKGRLVKRGTPQTSDYITVESGSSVSSTAVLPDGYDMTVPGDYEVIFVGRIRYRLLESSKNSTSKRKEKIQQEEQPDKLLLKVSSLPKPVASYKQDASYSSCDTGQIAILDEILTQAEQYAQEAFDSLTNTAPADQVNAGRYTTWFGNHTNSRYATAVTHFNSISSTLTNQTIEFTCDCTENYLAWVYPDEPYKIHLCSQFWPAPLTGTDSQAGTIIHETSHFIIVANTDDHVYGQPGSFSLAQTYPDDALDNADSHEYFAENSSYLPMRPLFTLVDDFADALVAETISVYSLTENNNTGQESSEPNHAGNSGGSSLWFSWKSPGAGIVQITTVGSGVVDTLLAVYTGEQLDNLTEVVANDDIDFDMGIYQSKVSFNATPDTTYHIAIDGYDGDTGLIYMALISDFGDVYHDGMITLDDAILALQVAGGKQGIADINLKADINGDTKIGIEEVLFILDQVQD